MFAKTNMSVKTKKVNIRVFILPLTVFFIYDLLKCIITKTNIFSIFFFSIFPIYLNKHILTTQYLFQKPNVQITPGPKSQTYIFNHEHSIDTRQISFISFKTLQ